MLSVLGIVIVVAVFAVFSNSKLFGRVKGWWYRSTNNAADAFGNVVDDMKDNIKNAGVEADNFKSKIAELMAANKQLDSDHKNAVSEAEKWASIAQDAAKAKQEDHVRAAIEKRVAAEKRSLELASNVSKNEKLIQKLRTQLNNRVDQIKTAESDITTQEARFTSLQMRERMLTASKSFGGNSLNDLENTKKELDAYENKLNAIDELSGDDAVELERIYKVDTKVDEEVRKLMSGV